ncbi:hypothetical protein Dimus_010591 [Dionaea muscipula]
MEVGCSPAWLLSQDATSRHHRCSPASLRCSLSPSPDAHHGEAPLLAGKRSTARPPSAAARLEKSSVLADDGSPLPWSPLPAAMEFITARLPSPLLVRHHAQLPAEGDFPAAAARVEKPPAARHACSSRASSAARQRGGCSLAVNRTAPLLDERSSVLAGRLVGDEEEASGTMHGHACTINGARTRYNTDETSNSSNQIELMLGSLTFQVELDQVELEF